MRTTIMLVLALLVAPVYADDIADAGAKIHEYFAAFNERDLDKIANEIYATPVLFAGGENRTVYATPADVISSQTSLFEMLDSQNWVESRISDLVVSLCSSSIAFVDTQYSRLDANGDAIPPAVRTNLYVVQKLDGEWHIISFFGHDNNVRPSC